MNNLYDDFDLDLILSKLKSSVHLENQLYANYQEDTFQRMEYKSFKKKRPLLVKELYLLISKLGDLPTLQQFQEYYKSKHRIKNNNLFSEMTALTKGYRSLVRDLHFYFLLKESKLFDEVKISYLFDLQAKTDILLSKGQKRLGLQLFSGGNNMKIIKQEKNKKITGKNNFELIYFGTKYKGERKLLDTKSGVSFLLYSEGDVNTVNELMDNVVLVETLIDEEQCEKFDEFLESVPLKQIPVRKKSTNARHSILEIGKLSLHEIETRRKSYLQQGIIFYHYKKAIPENIVIIDGVGFERYEILIDDKSQINFNIEQYKIEHALTDIDISIVAGAGSGKTYTLVSRALYLLNMGIIEHVYEIAMITFTNEAANNILESLEKRFLQLFKYTNDSRYLRYLDELREMKIMTIPAFAKYILFEYGHQIGLGQNFNISPLITKRNELIDIEIHRAFKKGDFKDDDFDGMEFYQLTEFVKSFSDKVEQKGVFVDSLLTKVDSDNLFEQLVINTQVQVEKELGDYKQDRDVLGLSDLTRYLRLLIRHDVSMDSLNRKFKYLFVDEFQDTDILQIEFIAKLAIKTGIRLVAVGDIKQGIYRFRGANVTAFEMLADYLNEGGRQIEKAYLSKNYRTAADVLNNLEDIFDIWKKNNHLSQGERLIPTKPNSSSEASYIECHNRISGEAVVSLFNEMNIRPREESHEVRVMAILVRTNSKVNAINTLLSETCAQKDIPLQIVKEGTLFKSRSAKDLLALLHSWLYIDDKIAQLELAQTAFCKPFKIPRVRRTAQYEMDDLHFDLPITWMEASKQFKLAPGLIVLNEFLQNTPYDDYLLEETQSPNVVKQYVLNLHKILTLMANGVQNDQADLYSLYNWLKIEVLTNTRDDEADLTDTDFGRDYIKVMTVHKSKGLEFDTVVIPYVKDQIVYPTPRHHEIIVEVEDENVQYSWNYKPSSRFGNTTKHFQDMRKNENPLIIQEEARNLYVALTRAKERLAIFDMKGYVKTENMQNPNSWFHLIKGGRNDAISTCFNLCNCRSTI